MVRFKMYEKVIVCDHGVNKVGIITLQTNKQKHRVYNVRMENGVEHNFIRVDNFNSNYYINSELSKRLSHQINTNLNEISHANHKK